MREIAVGLIGYGMGGSVFHAPLINSVPGLKLASIATTRRDQVNADLPGIDVVSRPEMLIGDPAIDLVVISSPTATHYPLAAAALNAGKHVVVDKPFTTTVTEAEDLMSLAVTRKLCLSVFQNRRWDNDFRTVYTLIKQGRLGTVYHYEAHFDRFRPQLKPGWREEGGPGSGILYDLGAHLIDQAIVLFGMPSSVFADAFAQRPIARSVDYFHLILEYRWLRVILHGATLVRNPGPHYAVHGDAGSFLKYGMDPQEEDLKAGRRPGEQGWGADRPETFGTLTDAGGNQQSIETLPGSYERYYMGMRDAIAGGAPVPVNPAEPRDGLVVIEAALRSVAEKRVVPIA